MSDSGTADVRSAAEGAARLVEMAARTDVRALDLDEVGEVTSVGRDIAEITGLPGLRAEELVVIRGTHRGMALNLDPDRVGVIMLDPGAEIEAGDRVHRTGRVMDVPVGEGLLGRVVDPRGEPQDGQGRIRTMERYPVERPAPGIFDRRPVEEALQTGLKVVDAMVPIGRGQRELILGDRQTGKTTVALDTIVAQKGLGVICIYCAVGERSASLAKAVAALRTRGAMEHTVIVATTGEDPAGLQFVAPYAATSMAEWFMERGHDVVIVYDDLTRHARAYRQVSLLLRRPPGREAYPGDIFYVHSRLLERSTRLTTEKGGGSLTALPIVETRAQNMSAYIPTNLISITDGQIYLSPRLFHQGVLPAVDVGRSVSRVGGRAQISAYRAVAGSLRLTYSQFEELERFTRYGARLEGARRRALERGERVREVLKQSPMSPLTAGEQIAVLLAVEEGVFDGVPIDQVAGYESDLLAAVRVGAAEVLARIERGDDLSDDDRSRLLEVAMGVRGDGHA